MKIPIFISIAIVAIALIIPTAHYISFDRDSYLKDISNYTKLSNLGSLSYSISWFEPRVRRFESSINRANPQLLPQDRLSFIYGNCNVK